MHLLLIRIGKQEQVDLDSLQKHPNHFIKLPSRWLRGKHVAVIGFYDHHHFMHAPRWCQVNIIVEKQSWKLILTSKKMWHQMYLYYLYSYRNPHWGAQILKFWWRNHGGCTLVFFNLRWSEEGLTKSGTHSNSTASGVFHFCSLVSTLLYPVSLLSGCWGHHRNPNINRDHLDHLVEQRTRRRLDY